MPFLHTPCRSRPLRSRHAEVVLVLGCACLASAVLAAAPPLETSFLAENAAAMDKMMVNMNVEPTGNVDRDFAASMIPHHQGAIDMALAELRYGHDVRLRRLAQEIIVSQNQEIVAMRMALDDIPNAADPMNVRAPASRADEAADLPHHYHP